MPNIGSKHILFICRYTILRLKSINIMIFLFHRGMLSAAHILAMDAKNLLDVIDSIRIRYPYVDNQICQKQNDVVNRTRESTPENRIRSSQSGEQFLRRSQSSERQGATFRQSQSGDLLHRMGQSVDRSSPVS